MMLLLGDLSQDEALDFAIGVSRFWSCVAPPDENGCRDWLGDTTKDSYGVFFLAGRRWSAHELAVTLTTGERRLPELDTCHSCNRPICVASEHLRFDTRQSNVADAMAAGTHRIRSKVTADDVLIIRERVAAGAPFKVIGDRYGLSAAGISAICSGRNWKHVGGPTEKRPPGRRSRVNTGARNG